MHGAAGGQAEPRPQKAGGQKAPEIQRPGAPGFWAAGRTAHGFVHGKIYEVEHENVGTEAAHHAELAGEAVLRQGTRYVKRRIREHPGRPQSRDKVH